LSATAELLDVDAHAASMAGFQPDRYQSASMNSWLAPVQLLSVYTKLNRCRRNGVAPGESAIWISFCKLGINSNQDGNILVLVINSKSPVKVHMKVDLDHPTAVEDRRARYDLRTQKTSMLGIFRPSARLSNQLIRLIRSIIWRFGIPLTSKIRAR